MSPLIGVYFNREKCICVEKNKMPFKKRWLYEHELYLKKLFDEDEENELSDEELAEKLREFFSNFNNNVDLPDFTFRSVRSKRQRLQLIKEAGRKPRKRLAD